MLLTGKTQQDIINEDTTKTIDSLLLKIESEDLAIILKDGFSYSMVRIQADPIAQQNATGFLTAVSQGILMSFPVQWRTKDNTTYYIQDMEELKVFSSKMLQFVQTVFHYKWNLKDQVRLATTPEQAQSIYDSGISQMKLIGDSL